MATKYLYLDDENKAATLPLAQQIELAGSGLRIILEHPGKYQKDLSSLMKDLLSYDGLILDWRLDDVRDPELRVTFGSKAATVAQEIRTRSTEGRTKSIPIVIWSTQQKLKKSYDQTSEDLFDAHYFKDAIDEQPEQIHSELISLADGYKTLRSLRKKDACSILKVQEKYLDIRLRDRLNDQSWPVHRYARFIIKELRDRPGPLISKELLLARLGVDSEGPTGSVSRLLKTLSAYRYKGPFGEAWPRWWSYGIEREWWLSLQNVSQSLSFLSADERVKIINASLHVKLRAAKPIQQNYQNRFYTICEHFKRPLDPIDGVIIDEEEPAPWQERRYLSLKAALERLSDTVQPHLTERDRLKALRRKGG